MSDENTPNVSSESTSFDFASLLSDAKPAPTVDKGAENSGGAPQEEPAPTVGDDDAGVGDEDAGSPGASQSYTFDSVDYTEEQVAAALKASAQNQAFTQSIAPLVDNIKQFSDQAARFQAMAVTETEKQIEEFTKALQSGQLNAQDYQLTHQALNAAITRKGVLEQAAEQMEQKRQQALTNARRQKAATVATALVQRGWTQQQMQQAQSVAMNIIPMDAFADVVSPEFMQILKDAHDYRQQRATAAAKLQQDGKRVVKTAKAATTATAPKVSKAPAAGSPEWMSKLWGGQ